MIYLFISLFKKSWNTPLATRLIKFNPLQYNITKHVLGGNLSRWKESAIVQRSITLTLHDCWIFRKERKNVHRMAVYCMAQTRSQYGWHCIVGTIHWIKRSQKDLSGQFLSGRNTSFKRATYFFFFIRIKHLCTNEQITTNTTNIYNSPPARNYKVISPEVLDYVERKKQKQDVFCRELRLLRKRLK